MPVFSPTEPKYRPLVVISILIYMSHGKMQEVRLRAARYQNLRDIVLVSMTMEASSWTGVIEEMVLTSSLVNYLNFTAYAMLMFNRVLRITDVATVSSH